MSETKPPDPDAEREVDLRSAWTRITARWYLPVAGLVIGAILGVLASASGGEVFRRPDAALPRPALHDLGRRPDPEPRHEPEDREPDHPLRVDAAEGVSRQRAHARPAARPRHLGCRRQRRPGQERDATRRDHGDASAGHKAEKAADSLANTVIAVGLDRSSTRRSSSSTSRSPRARQSSPTSTQRVSNAVAQQQAVINDKTLSSTDKLIASTPTTTRSASPSSVAARFSRSCSRTSSCSRSPRTSRRARS